MAEGWAFELCPGPPDWALDWEAIARRFTWIRTLEGVPQEASYHGEGNVLVHTRMVAEALAGLAEWRGLPVEERGVLLLAALLHDVAKPACTIIDADGKVRSPGHARMGAQMARYVLWEGAGFDAPVPFSVREAVARLVRFHGLPLWFCEKADPEQAIVAASQSTRLDHVALLAEADVRGRICADQVALLERVALFRAFCDEARCYAEPHVFATEHSRFVYFRSGRPDLTYVPYDDTAFEVVLLSGLPGVGKDTWIRAHLAGWPVISLDALRREMGVAPDRAQGAVVRAAKERARELMRRQVSFVWNATNVTRAIRGPLIDIFATYHARTRVVYLDAPRDVVFRRNRERARPVPEAVIDKLAHKLEVPDLTEAHRVEWITSEDAFGI
jgi:putative nucleotidyltransferase with HDIG domain